MNGKRLLSNYEGILSRGRAAALRAGRAEDSFRLVAVTKTVSAAVACALVDLGARDLGENRVQELLSKQSALACAPVSWHLIGRLQTNKARKVAGRVSLIHSVDSLRLAQALDEAAAQACVVQDVLLEVNVSAEASKCGFRPDDAPDAAARMKSFSCLRVLGLMTMAPIVENPEETRPLFRALRELADAMSAAGLFASGRCELSMGMTQDFEVAVEEGATLVRVGSALFEGVEPPGSRGDLT
jgi:hypothetical protein